MTINNTYKYFDIQYDQCDLLSQSKHSFTRWIIEEFKYKAWVRGWKVMEIFEGPNDKNPLPTIRVVRAYCHPLPPSPGYDSEGRECWDYPCP